MILVSNLCFYAHITPFITNPIPDSLSEFFVHYANCRTCRVCLKSLLAVPSPKGPALHDILLRTHQLLTTSPAT